VPEAPENATLPLSARDPYPVAARKLLRETLLDAALDELGRRDWDEITMADIAKTAGVSRQTLYKEFGSRDEFAQAFVLREGERFLAAVEGAILGNVEDPLTALRSALEVFLGASAEHPLVRSAIGGRHGADSILPLITTQGEPLIGYAVARLAEIIATGWPQVAREEIELLAESLVRLAISYLVMRPDSVDATAAALTRLLGPFLEQALAEAGPATA